MTAGSWEEEEGGVRSYHLIGIEFRFCKIKRVLEKGSSDGY